MAANAFAGLDQVMSPNIVPFNGRCADGGTIRRKPVQLQNQRKALVGLDGEASNQIFAELAAWEQILKDTSLAKQAPPAP